MRQLEYGDEIQTLIRELAKDRRLKEFRNVQAVKAATAGEIAEVLEQQKRNRERAKTA